MTFALKRDWLLAESRSEAALAARNSSTTAPDRFRTYADYYNAIMAAKLTSDLSDCSTQLAWNETLARREAMVLAFAKWDAWTRGKQTSTNVQ
jgi:hypothetical protein